MLRCSKCLLPSFLSESEFDINNECSWCKSGYPNYNPKGVEQLNEVLTKNLSKSNSADCLVGLSGGKDSSYALIELHHTFKLKVEAFTYVHEGLTSHALENAKNICQNIGVKHHIVSLPGNAHLNTFKTFFRSWLKNPSSVAANMACVACKHLHILGSELAVRRNIPMVVWAMVPLETPPFLPTKKKGNKNFERKGVFENSKIVLNEMYLSPEFRKSILKHFSTCLLGSLALDPNTKFLQIRYPSIRHIPFFHFIDWEPESIREKLVKIADWKKLTEERNDWHSDCVFFVLKEYMYQKMYGATYSDAFLSNQIRHGILSRDEAWEILRKNKNYFASEIYRALDFLELSDLSQQIDPSCFYIDGL
jgi:hypothetical protein